MKPNILPIKNLIAILAIIMLFSCNKQSDYLQSIPADANIVITLNPKSIAEKGNVIELLKNQKINERQRIWLNRLGPESKELFEKVLQNPTELGISLKNDIIFFSDAIENEIGLLLKIDDQQKFETFLSILSSEKGKDTNIKRENDIFISEINANAICTFDDNKALFLFALQYNTEITELKKDATALMNQNKEKSLLSNNGFSKFSQSNKDVNIWMSMAAIPSTTLKLYSSFLPTDLKISSIYSTTHIDFQRGKIIIESGSYSDDTKTKKALDNLISVVGKTSNSFLKQIPENSWLVWSVNLNGEKLYNILMENSKFAAEIGNVSKEINLQQLIGSIDGDLTMGLIDITSSSSYGYSPNLVFFAKVKDDSILNFLKDNLQLARITTLSENQHLISWSGTSIYFGMKDNKYLYVSTDKNIIDNFSKGIESPLSKTPFAEIFKSGGAMLINTQQILQNLPEELWKSSDATTYKQLLALFSSIEMHSEGQANKTIINMADSSDNALSTIIKSLDKELK